MRTECLSPAQAYTARGTRMLPVLTRPKLSTAEWWPDWARRYPERFECLRTHRPFHGIGIATKPESGLLPLDAVGDCHEVLGRQSSMTPDECQAALAAGLICQ